MRTLPLGGIAAVFFGAAIAIGGEPAAEAAFRPLNMEELNPLVGDWQAVVSTKAGWKGTLRANITLKRNHPEGSEFHALLALSWDLTFTDPKRATVSVKGTEKRALLLWQKGKQRYVQVLREPQILQKEFFEEILEIRPNDKAALKGLAKLRPGKNNTAPMATGSDSWTLEMAPALADVLPQQGVSGTKIDWDGKISWKTAKTK